MGFWLTCYSDQSSLHWYTYLWKHLVSLYKLLLHGLSGLDYLLCPTGGYADLSRGKPEGLISPYHYFTELYFHSSPDGSSVIACNRLLSDDCSSSTSNSIKLLGSFSESGSSLPSSWPPTDAESSSQSPLSPDPLGSSVWAVLKWSSLLQGQGHWWA